MSIEGGVGSLVIITGPEWDGKKIEISRREHDPRIRTHVEVRQLPLPDGVHYSAVFPALPAGAYVLWRSTTEPASTVVVAPGTVTELEWWACP